jgi:hypothetical protein
MASSFGQLIQQLQSPDPDQRRGAIMALANTKNRAALQPLAALYRSDPDPALRDLALKAGRYIQQTAGPAEPAEQPQEEGKPTVSKRDEEIAGRLLDSATNFHIEGDPGRAVENLGRALVLNPLLAKETFVQNLIMTITGMSVQQALPVLTHPDQREQLVLKMGGRKKLTRVQEHGIYADTATWNRVMIDLVIYWIANAISSIVTVVFLLDAINEMLLELGYMTPVDVDLDALLAASLPSLIGSSLINSLGGIFGLVLQLLAIHYAAILFLRGDGTIVYLFRRLVPFYTVLTAAFTVLFAILMAFGSVTEVWLLIPLLLAAGGIGAFYYAAELVGEVYRLFWGRCCWRRSGVGSVTASGGWHSSRMHEAGRLSRRETDRTAAENETGRRSRPALTQTVQWDLTTSFLAAESSPTYRAGLPCG